MERWTRITFYGWSLGFVLILACIAISGAVGLGDAQFPVGLGMGLGVGWLQRRMIADKGGSARAWLGATALGLAAPFLAHDVSKLLGFKLPYEIYWSIVIGGLLVGLLQSRSLRLDARRAALWTVASTIGWTLSGATVALNDKVLPKIPGIVGALIYVAVVLVGGILLGAVTGAALPRLTLDGRAPV